MEKTKESITMLTSKIVAKSDLKISLLNSLRQLVREQNYLRWAKIPLKT